MPRVVALLLGTGLPSGVTMAQSSQTQCSTFGTTITCDTRPVPTPPTAADWAALGASLRARRTASQLATAQAAMQQQQVQALVRAEARAEAESAAAARSSAEAVATINATAARWAEETARTTAAAQRLFVARWTPLVDALADFVGLDGGLRAAFVDRAMDVSADLWLVERQASTTVMRDALAPLPATLARDFQRFLMRVVRPSDQDVALARFTPAQLRKLVLPRVREAAADCFAVGKPWTAAEFREYELLPLLQTLRREIDADHAVADSIRRDDAQRKRPRAAGRTRPGGSPRP